MRSAQHAQLHGLVPSEALTTFLQARGPESHHRKLRLKSKVLTLNISQFLSFNLIFDTLILIIF